MQDGPGATVAPDVGGPDAGGDLGGDGADHGVLPVVRRVCGGAVRRSVLGGGSGLCGPFRKASHRRSDARFNEARVRRLRHVRTDLHDHPIERRRARAKCRVSDRDTLAELGRTAGSL
nr:hypothetical protein GCM10025732_10280 [Glycomyces mayteni]